MQPTEGVTIQRRTLDVEDYIDITRRHKGWIFGPFLFTLVVSVVGAYMWPDSYTSTAIIRIVPQQVLEVVSLGEPAHGSAHDRNVADGREPRRAEQHH